MHIAIKENKTTIKIQFFSKTRNGKLITCNGKLEMHIANTTNETNMKNKSFKKTRYCEVEK